MHCQGPNPSSCIHPSSGALQFFPDVYNAKVAKGWGFCDLPGRPAVSQPLKGEP